MSDPLDDLRGLLQAVEPSRTFERDTRERIARERARPARPSWLFFAPIAAAAAIVVAFSSLRSGALGDQSVLREPAVATPRGGLGGQSAVREPGVAKTTSTTSVGRPGSQVRRRDRGAQPRSRVESVAFAVPENAHADQAIGVRRLMTLIRAGKANVPVESVVFDDSGPVPVLIPVELKPIVIAPLPTGQGGGSEK